MFLTRREPGVPLSLFRSYPLPFSPPFLLYCSLPFLFFHVFFIELYLLQFPGRHSICCFPCCSHMFLTRREPGVPLSLFRPYPLPFSPPFLLYCFLPFLFFYVFFIDLIPEDVFILCIGFFTDSGRCFWGRNYRFCILCIPSGLYIYIFTHAFLYISVQLEGENIPTAEMLGSILTAEMLVKTISKGNHSICGNAGRKQFQGGSIPTAEMLV